MVRNGLQDSVEVVPLHGDDLRAVNWRAYMRLEKLFLKMFQVEPRVPVRMLLDVSASMATHGGLKFDYARKLAGALCYVGLVRLDSIEIHGFTNRLQQRVYSSGGRHRFSVVMEGLSAMRAAGATDYLAMVREFSGAYSQRGLVIVISDFLDDNGCERGLQYLTDFGHELMLLQIWSDEDRTPPWVGELELRDLAGALVPTDRVHVTELSLAHPDVVTVFIDLRVSHAPLAAASVRLGTAAAREAPPLRRDTVPNH